MTFKKCEPDTRQQVTEILPSILRKTLQDYENFVKEKTSTDTKLFSQKQTAGKAAIAHIMLLLKLAKWAGIEDIIENGEDYSRALEIARLEFESHAINDISGWDDIEDESIENEEKEDDFLY